MKYDLFSMKKLNTTMISFDERQNPLGLNVVSLVVPNHDLLSRL